MKQGLKTFCFLFCSSFFPSSFCFSFLSPLFFLSLFSSSFVFFSSFLSLHISRKTSHSHVKPLTSELVAPIAPLKTMEPRFGRNMTFQIVVFQGNPPASIWVLPSFQKAGRLSRFPNEPFYFLTAETAALRVSLFRGSPLWRSFPCWECGRLSADSPLALGRVAKSRRWVGLFLGSERDGRHKGFEGNSLE